METIMEIIAGVFTPPPVFLMFVFVVLAIRLAFGK
jgi:hypothetical protein